MLLGSAYVKATRKTLMILTPRVLPHPPIVYVCVQSVANIWVNLLWAKGTFLMKKIPTISELLENLFKNDLIVKIMVIPIFFATTRQNSLNFALLVH